MYQAACLADVVDSMAYNGLGDVVSLDDATLSAGVDASGVRVSGGGSLLWIAGLAALFIYGKSKRWW